MNSRQKGAVGVAQAIAYFTSEGYVVSVPISEAQRYDLVIERDNVLQRVEVKTTFYRKNERCSFSVHLKTCGPNKQSTTYLSEKDCELVFIWRGDGVRYLIPTDHLVDKDKVYLTSKWDIFIV